jgi:hypothetical protein
MAEDSEAPKQSEFDLGIEPQESSRADKPGKQHPPRSRKKPESDQGKFNLELEKPEGKAQARPVNASEITGGVLPAVDVIADKDRIISSLQELLKTSKASDPVDRNQAQIEKALELLVLPVWGDLPTKINKDNVHMRQVTGTNRNIQVTGINMGINSEEYGFVNSVVLGANAFRLAQNNRISGSLVVGDGAFEGGRFNSPSDRGRSSLSEGNIIENSVIFGTRALKYARGGKIMHSIVGGDDILTNAERVHLIDTHIVTSKGTKYVKDWVLTGSNNSRVL